MLIASSKYDSVEHAAEAVNHISVQSFLTALVQVALRVKLADLVNDEFFMGHFSFFLDPLVVLCSQLGELLELVNIFFFLIAIVTHFQRLRPALLVQIHQHFLLKLVLAEVNCHTVVVSVQAVLKRRHVRLFQVSDV